MMWSPYCLLIILFMYLLFILSCVNDSFYCIMYFECPAQTMKQQQQLKVNDHISAGFPPLHSRGLQTQAGVFEPRCININRQQIIDLILTARVEFLLLLHLLIHLLLPAVQVTGESRSAAL